MSRTKIRCQLSATACSTFVGTISYRERIGLAPEQGAEKNLRVSAINRSPAPLFAHFFWQDRRNQIANQRSVCNLERTSNGTDETCRLRRGEGLREAPRAQALRRAIGLAERMQSEASLGVCEDEGLRSNSCGVTATEEVW